MSTNNNFVPSPTASSSCKPTTSNSKKSAQLDDRTRLKRNAGEKKRRDKLNNYISELSAMVPSCRMPQSQRKLDKSTILKLTVSYMKLHADLLPESVDESAMNWKPSFLSNEELGQLMLEALDGFLFVIWSTGRTIYVSDSITPLLGHLQQELVGKDFLELVHPEDISMVRDRMFPHQSESGYIEDLSTPSPEPINSPSSTTSDSPTFLRRNFVMRMCRGGFASSKTEYEMVTCSGHLRRWNEVTRNSPVDTTDMLPLDGYCLVGVGRLQCSQAIREMTPSGPSLNAWTSHHSLDAKYIHIDQNASPILGYTAAELLGSNGYNFYHDEDLNGLARSHVDLTKSGTGDTSLYRFLTKGQQWLWIKTRGVVKYQEGTKQPTSIICHNIVASYAEVWQYLQNKTRQYGPKERRLMAAPPPDVARTVAASTKTEQTSPGNEIKVEQYSPQSVHCQDASYSMYYAPSDTPSPRKGAVSEGTPIQLTPSPGPSSHHSPYYNSPSSAPTPNFIAFTTTEYVQPSLPGGGGAGGATFNELFPNYRASISTEETHGKYKAPANMSTVQQQQGGAVSQFQREYPPPEDVKPMYVPRQASFLETMTSSTPPPAEKSCPSVRPGTVLMNTSSPQSSYQSPTNLHTPPNNLHTPPSNLHTPPNNLHTPPNNLHTPPSNLHTPPTNLQTPPTNLQSAPSNLNPAPGNLNSGNKAPVTPSDTPNVLVTTPAKVVVMGQPGYVGSYMVPPRNQHQVPNVTVRSMAMKSEEPVVGMPVNTGFPQKMPVTTAGFAQHIVPTAAFSQPLTNSPATFNQQMPVTTATFNQQLPVTTATFNQQMPVTTTHGAFNQQMPVSTAHTAFNQQMPVTTAHTAFNQQMPATTAHTAFNQQMPVTTAPFNQQIPVTTNGSHQSRTASSHINSQFIGMSAGKQHHDLMNFPKKGVSVYSSGAPEKRCASPGNLNSCAQMSMKRMRNESPNNQPSVPSFSKGVASPSPHHYNGGQYNSGPFIAPGGAAPHSNGYHHPGQHQVTVGGVVTGAAGDMNHTSHPSPLVVGAATNHLIERQDNNPTVHAPTIYQSIDTGQQHVVHKQT